jgi:hypothetical protein
MSSATPPCVRCGAKLEGECPSVNGKEYHAKCFNCAICRASLMAQPVRLLNNEPVCVPCKKVRVWSVCSVWKLVDSRGQIAIV